MIYTIWASVGPKLRAFYPRFNEVGGRRKAYLDKAHFSNYWEKTLGENRKTKREANPPRRFWRIRAGLVPLHCLFLEKSGSGKWQKSKEAFVHQSPIIDFKVTSIRRAF